jgi:hypothetical protein
VLEELCGKKCKFFVARPQVPVEAACAQPLLLTLSLRRGSVGAALAVTICRYLPHPGTYHYQHIHLSLRPASDGNLHASTSACAQDIHETPALPNIVIHTYLQPLPLA